MSVYESTSMWKEVDSYFSQVLIAEDDALITARESARLHHLPPHEVAANQGAFLGLLTRAVGARRVLEIGTLAGYSTIWLARAVGDNGHVTTLEVEPQYAAIAQENLRRAGVSQVVDLRVGPALNSLATLVRKGVEPFDLVFIDADKPNNPGYLEAALALTRRGSLIIGDNVVRDGEVADAASQDDRVQGVRTFLAMLGSDPRLDATALQTVGSKGWDGFAIAVVRTP
ncbi:O-methyltransferase [Geodermatophilus sp. FMUSA9-8]|uniref:O-methyltransferase n=1 Tax=Geodermatophilus sp. FMUSA9-8 TaxID=3120155 RepID=UPI00300ABC2D